MIKKGKFTILGNKEYRLGKEGEDWVNLVSKDGEDTMNGFQPHPLDSTVLIKKVLKSELNLSYQINTYAIYKGHRLEIGSEKEDKILVGTGDSRLAEELKLDRTDKYFYEKWIDKSDVQLVEEKKPISI